MDKNEEEVPKNMSYILQFTDSARFMASSLSNLVNNLSGGIDEIKCKYGQDNKWCETCGNSYKACDCFLEYANFKYNSIEYKSLCCYKHYQQTFDEKLEKRFFNTYKFFIITIKSYGNK